MLLALLLLAMSLFNHWQCAVTTPTTDFLTYWGVPQVLRVNRALNMYDREGQKSILTALGRMASSPDSPDNMRHAADITARTYGQRVDATGSPFLYALAGAFSTGDYGKDQRNFIAFCFLCFIAAVLILCFILNYSAVTALLLLIFFSSFYAPVLSDLRVGNTNQVQLLVIALFMLLTVRSKRFWAGLVIGMGIMLKPNIALVWLFFVFVKIVDGEFRRQFPLFAGTAAGMFAAALFSAVYFGSAGVWMQFAATLPGMLASSYPVSNGNMALSGLLAELTGLRLSAGIWSILCAAFAALVFLTRRVVRQCVTGVSAASGVHDMFAIVGIGCAVPLLSANLAWLHYFILLIPLAVYLLRPAESGPSGNSGLRTAVQLATAAALLLFSTPAEFILNDMTLQSAACGSASAIIMLAALYELWQVRSRLRAGL